MKYKLILQKNNDIKEVIYDSRLNCFDQQFTIKNSNEYSNKSLLINIYMGGKCNYKCKYCLQSDDMKNGELYDTKNINEFVLKLINYINTYFQDCEHYKILLWGGEPLVYFDTMKRIHKEFLKYCDENKFNIGFCTNGSLIDEKVFEWVNSYKNIGFTLSYDGPGQYLRHESDVLDTNKQLLEYFRTNKNWSVNPVWTKANNNLTNFINFINDKVGHHDWKIGDNTQQLIVTDDKILEYCLSEKELQELTIDFCKNIHFQNKSVLYNYSLAARRFISHLNDSSRVYKCINSSKNAKSINIDLAGNIWACHSCVGSKKDCLGGNLYIGTLDSERTSVEYKFLDYKYESRCIDCVMRMICCGGCPLTDKKYVEHNCINNWYKSYPVLFIAMNILTDGYQLTSIDKLE